MVAGQNWLTTYAKVACLCSPLEGCVSVYHINDVIVQEGNSESICINDFEPCESE